MLGQYAGIGALFVASAVAALLSVVVPAAWLPWLGLLPVLMGVRLLLRENGDAAQPESAASGLTAVTTITLASGADNIAVYVPLFAARDIRAIAIMAAVFVAMIAFWCLAARWLVRHPAAGAPLRRWGPSAVPWALIGIGLWILLS